MSTEQVPHISLSSEVADTDSDQYPRAVPFPSRDTSTKVVVYPKWIYIRERQGRYLTARDGLLTFQSGEPDHDCAFQPYEHTSRAHHHMMDRTGKYVVMKYEYIGTDPAHFTMGLYSSESFHFDTILARESKVHLKCDLPGDPYVFSNEMLPSGAPMAHKYMNQDSEMDIIAAAVSSEIVNVDYDIQEGKVREAAPVIALSTSVRNDSDGDVSQTLSYNYEKWTVGTWNNAAGVDLGGKMNFKAGVPFIASAEWEIAISAEYLHEWGAEEGKRAFVSSSTTVTVPPKKKARATIIVRNAQIDVGFTYTQRTMWSNGQSEDQEKTGVYNNVDSWHVDVVLDNWENV